MARAKKLQKLKAEVLKIQKTVKYYKKLFLEDGYIDEGEQQQLDQLSNTIVRINKKIRALEEQESTEPLPTPNDHKTQNNTENATINQAIQNILSEDSIVELENIDSPFSSTSNEDGIGDFFLTFVIDFKVTAFTIFDANGKIVYTVAPQGDLPIKLDVDLVQLGLGSGVYYAAAIGSSKKEVVAKKITYIKSDDKAILFAKIATTADSIESIIEELGKLKETTRRKIQAFNEIYGNYCTAYELYLQKNLEVFFNSTTTSQGLSVGADFVNKLIAGATSDRTSLLLEKVGGKALVEKKIAGGMTALATALGGAAGNAPGAVAGFLVGTAIDVFVNYVLGGILPSDAEQAIVENQKLINAYIQQLNKAIKDRIFSSKAKMSKIINIDQDLVYISKETKEVEFIYKVYAQGVDFLSKQKIPDNLTLANALLKIWLKENAGDDADDGNRYVSDDQWDTNLKTLRANGVITGGEGGLSNEWDTFIYQFEAELARWGILDNCRTIIDEMHACTSKENSIEGVYGEYHQKKIKLGIGTVITDFDTFFKQVKQTDDSALYGIPIDNHMKKSFEDGTMEFAIVINLSKDENSLFITHFDYILKDDVQSIGIKNPRMWSENIDNGISK
jgi:hypothetical protein